MPVAPPNDLENKIAPSIARILDNNAQVVGAGVLINERTIITTAQVVAEALGKSDDLPPNASTLTGQIHLDFPYIKKGRIFLAENVNLVPLRSDGGGNTALIMLKSSAPEGARPMSFFIKDNISKDLWGHRFWAFVFSSANPLGNWTYGKLLNFQENTNLIKINIEYIDVYGAKFGGTPIWDENLNEFIGIGTYLMGSDEEGWSGNIDPADNLVHEYLILNEYGKRSGNSEVRTENEPNVKSTSENKENTDKLPEEAIPAGFSLGREFTGHSSYINRIAWSPDGQILASGSNDKTIKLWDFEKGKLLFTLQGHDNTISDISWSPDSRRLVSASKDGKMIIWNTKTGVIELQRNEPAPVDSIAWNPVRNEIIAYSSGKQLKRWVLDFTKESLHGSTSSLQLIENHSDTIYCARWSPSGQILVSSSGDHAISIWDINNEVSNGRYRFSRIEKAHSDSIYGISWSPTGEIFASGSNDGTIRIWGKDETLQRELEKCPEGICDLTFSFQGRFLASKSVSGTVRIWDSKGWVLIAELKVKSSVHFNWGLAFHPSKLFLATLDRTDKKIRIWNLDSAALELFHLLEINPNAIDDAYSKVDLLGFADYADAFVDLFENIKTKEPLVVGIDASWGMGKTTLMHMIEERLSKGDFITIWFNAWKYDKEDSLWAAMALTVINDLKKQYRLIERLIFWFRLTLKRFSIAQASWLILIDVFIPILLLVAAFSFDSNSVSSSYPNNSKVLSYAASQINNLTSMLPIPDAVSQNPIIWNIMLLIGALVWGFKQYSSILKNPFQISTKGAFDQPNYVEKIGFIGSFQRDFENIVSIATNPLIKPKSKKLVIFIDDLDRCSPPKPVEIIEAINIFMDANNCIFIVGMDGPTVAASIETKYKDLKSYFDNSFKTHNELPLGQRFLEKIIQINFRIPESTQDAVKNFINEQMGIKGSQEARKDGRLQAEPPSKELILKARESLENSLPKARKEGKTLDQIGKEILAEKPDLTIVAINEAKKEVFSSYLFEEYPEVSRVLEKVPELLEFNPRKIKRFLNNYRLQALIASRRGLFENKCINLESLANFVIISMRWPDVINVIVSDKDFIKRLKEAYDLNQIKISGKDLKKEDRLKLDSLLKEPFIKKMINAKDFIGLMDDILLRPGSFEIFLCLSEIVSSD